MSGILLKKWKKWFSVKKMKDKVNLLFMAIFFMFALLILFLYQFIIRSNLKSYAIQNNKDTLVSIGSNVHAKIDSINTLSKQIMINSVITQYLNAGDGRELLLNAAANRTVDEFFSLTQDVSSIYIFRLDGEYVKIGNGTVFFKEENLWNEKLQNAIFEGEGSYLLSWNGKGAFYNKNGEGMLTFYRLINDISSQKPSGILAINLSTDTLYNCIKDFSNEIKEFCIVDEEGTVLLKYNWSESSHPISIGDDPYDHISESKTFGEKVTSYYKIPDTNLIVLSYEMISLVTMVTREFLIAVIIIVMFVAAMISLLNYTVKYYVTRPIEKLVQSMEEVKRGWFHRVSIELPDDEIGQLKDSYNRMLIELNGLFRELLDKEKTIRKAELDILQEQIKPHFLYNTIDMIGNLALEEGAEGVFEALETLGDFYRKFLSKGSRAVTIEEEIKIVQNYLKLQKMRYGDIFEDIYEVEDNLNFFQVPKLILQPLVENSLYHGIRMKGGKGIIRTRVSSENDNIIISVYDSGIGISQEVISQILNSHEFKSFGVKGTLERIRYFYDFRCECSIISEESRFTEIVITIPVKQVSYEKYFGGTSYVQSNDC